MCVLAPQRTACAGRLLLVTLLRRELPLGGESSRWATEQAARAERIPGKTYKDGEAHVRARGKKKGLSAAGQRLRANRLPGEADINMRI